MENSQLDDVGPVVGDHGGEGEEEGEEAELEVPDHHRWLAALLDQPLVEDAGKSGGAAGNEDSNEACHRVLVLFTRLDGNGRSLNESNSCHENKQRNPLTLSETSSKQQN